MQPLIDFKGNYGPRYVVYAVEGETATKITPDGFPSQKQTDYFDAVQPYVLFGGARGGGKTEAIIWDHVLTGYLIPGSKSVIYRKTLNELSDTIISRFRELPVELVGEYHGDPLNRHMRLPNGSEIRFRSAKDKSAVRKSLGGEYVLTSFDEWAEWEYTDWTFVTGASRSVITRDIFNRPFVAQVKGATQPGGDGSDALNHLFGGDIEKSPAIGMDAEKYKPEDYHFVKSLVDDNPAYAPDTEAGIAYRRMLNTQPPGRRDAWLLGKWTGFEGQFFDVFQESVVKIPHDEVIAGMSKQRHQPIWLAGDYGKTHHSYFTWNTFLEAQLDDGSTVKLPVTYREYLVKDLGEAAVAQEVASRTPVDERSRIVNIYLSPELGSGSLSRAAQMGDVWISRNMPRSMPAYNDREDGWAVMYKLLAYRHKLLNGWVNEDGEEVNMCAGWLVDEDCKYLLEAIPWATADPDHDGDIKAKGDSPMLDILDGSRYGIASYVRPEEQKPFADRMKDAIGALPVAGSSRFIKYLKMRKEERESVAPYYTGQRTSFGLRRSKR